MAKKLKTLRQRMADGTMPPPAEFKNPEECIAAYESGFEGAIYDPDSAEECEAQKYGVFGDAAREFGIEDSGKGKLSLLYPAVWECAGRDDFFHGSLSQPTGDCVSRGQSHAAIASLANAVQNGNGSWPQDIPEEAYKSGMPFHPTPTYWCKRGSESGWSCGAAASRSKDEIGLTVMKSYPDNPNIGDLLLKYNTSVIKKYCRSGPPSDVVKTLNYNMTLTYSRTKSFEEIRDAIANGYGVASCGSAGFGKGSNARDVNGFCKRSGSWNHSMCTIGCDDTEWAHKNYGSALYLVLNSWASYLGNARPKVQGRDDIPPIPRGSFWCLANSKGYGGRDSYVISSLQGYPPQKLKDWNLRGLI